jgi:hypothetical protein
MTLGCEPLLTPWSARQTSLGRGLVQVQAVLVSPAVPRASGLAAAQKRLRRLSCMMFKTPWMRCTADSAYATRCYLQEMGAFSFRGRHGMVYTVIHWATNEPEELRKDSG